MIAVRSGLGSLTPTSSRPQTLVRLRIGGVESRIERGEDDRSVALIISGSRQDLARSRGVMKQ